MLTKKTKLILVAAGIFLGLIILTPIVFLFYLETDHAQNFIRSKVNQAIPGTILWKKFRFSLLRGRFELKNALLKSPSGEELAGFERLFVNISWPGLFRKSLTVEELTLEKPSASLRVDENGKLNLTEAFPPGEEKKEKTGGLPLNIIVHSLNITQGDVRYEADAQAMKIMAADIGLAGSGNFLEQSGKLEFQIGSASVSSPKIQTELDQFRIEALIREGKIDPLVVKIGAGDAATLSLSGNIADALKEPLFDLTLDIAASLPEIRESLRLEPELTGQAGLHLKARGKAGNPDVTLALNYGGGSLAGNQIDRIDLDSHLKDRLLTIGSLEIDAASGDIRLEGNANLQEAFANGFLSPERDLEAISYNLSLKENNINFEELAPGKNLKGKITSADISVQGKGISPKTLSAELMLKLFAEQLTASQIAAPIDLSLNTNAKLDQGVITAENIDARAGDIRLQADGNFLLFPREQDQTGEDISQPIAASLTLDAPSLSDGLAPLGIADTDGALHLKADVSGSIKQPVFDCELNGKQLKFRDIAIGNLSLDAALDQSGLLRISQLGLENQDSSLHGQGTVQIFEKDSFKVNSTFPSDVSLTLKNIKPRNFLKQAVADGVMNGNLSLKGNLNALKATVALQGKKLAVNAVSADDISLEADLSGSLKKPGGTVKLVGKNIDLGAQKLREVSLLSELDGEKINIRPLRIAISPKETVEAVGWVSMEKAYQIELKSQGISLRNIDKVREQDIAKGKILLNLSGKGSFENPQVEGDIAVKNLRVKGKKIDDFQIRISLNDQLAKLSGKLNFDIDGSFHLKKKDFSASVRFDKTDLSPYFKFADQKDLSGTLTGKIEARGNAGAVDKIQADADLSKLMLFMKKNELVSAKNFKASLAGEEFSIPGSRLRLLRKGYFDVSGKGKIKGPFDIKLDGDVPLEVASLFTGELPDIKGKLSLSARMKGTPSDPDIRGTIGLDKVSMTVPGLQQRLHDVQGKIEVTPKVANIKKIKGQLDSGQFDLTGKIDLDKFKPVKISANLNTHALPINVPDTLDMLLNTSLRVRGTPEKSAITGDAVILEGTYYKDVNLSLLNTLQNVGKKKRETAPSSPSSGMKGPFLKNMSLDISVKRRNAFLVDNNLAQLEINPDLRIYGTLNRPLVSGRANIDSGTITYQKRTFDVKKGVIDFLNPYKIEPTLDVESEVTVRKWAVFLAVSGTPDALNFNLTSTPPEEHGDILSLLVLGKTTKELSKGGGGSSSAPTQMIAEVIEETFGDDIKKAAGLDILKVEFQGEGDQGDSDDVTVTMGKKLSRQMTVKYAVESRNGETVQRAIADYKFLENVLLTIFQDSKGTFGGELQFRLEFR
ncbi:translocation/assembly module TamB domain-containing protein [Desulfococcaceae bacterium HSG8]|nr:translocation/assembly module TamB domain-containing protein [Desulfococcaceae bacterium HSG8]